MQDFQSMRGGGEAVHRSTDTERTLYAVIAKYWKIVTIAFVIAGFYFKLTEKVDKIDKIERAVTEAKTEVLVQVAGTKQDLTMSLNVAQNSLDLQKERTSALESNVKTLTALVQRADARMDRMEDILIDRRTRQK